MAAAAFAWFFFLALCPAITLLTLAWTAQRPAVSVGGHVWRAASAIAVLVLLVGPASTSAGFMPWWDVPLLVSFTDAKLHLLEYAGVCAAIYVVLAWRTWFKRRPKGTKDASRPRS